MSWLRSLVLAGAVVLLAATFALGQPRPTPARADIGGSIACGAADGGVGALGDIAEDVTGGAIGAGNPLGDLCDKVVGKVTDTVTSPVTDALKGVGDDVFKEMTKWVAQGAGWLMGQVVEAVNTSTTPHLRREGFLSEYEKMSAIAVLLAVAALLAAILQGIAQGNAGLMLRVVLVNAPLAFIGTSVAFVVVQLLVGATDSLCHAITAGTGEHGSKLFESAIADLGKVGGDVGEAPTNGGIAGVQGHELGQAAVPLFVGFLLAVVGALAALCVLLELLFRDAGIYAVSLFMPFALYASISPRWRGVMRRYAQALFALIESKFIIVAIITLAGTLVSKETTSVEVVLVASALMALSCFAPFTLFRFVSISEGAAAASFGRRSAGGAVVGGASRTTQTARSVARMAGVGGGGGAGQPGGGSGVRLWNSKDLAQSAPAPPTAGGGGRGEGGSGSRGGPDPKGSAGGPGEGPPRPSSGAPKGSSPSTGATAAGAGPASGAAGSPAKAVAATGAATARAPQRGADRLSSTGVAKAAGGDDSGKGGDGAVDRAGAGDGGGGRSAGTTGPSERAPRPDVDGPSTGGGDTAGGSRGAPERVDKAPRPSPERPETLARPPEDAGASS